MIILPTIGVEKVRLGMNRSQVKNALGKAIEIEKSQSEEVWFYGEGLEMSFQKDDLYLLGTISITNPDAKLDAKKIIGLSESELVKEFPFLVLEDDFEENGKDYVCPIKELSVWVSDGVVSNVTLFPAYEESGEIPLWPKIST